MSKTLGELISNTRALVGDPLRGDPVEQPTTYTQVDVIKAINWSISLLCERTGYTYNLVSPTSVGLGMYATPSDNLKIMYVMNGTNVLDPSTVEWENIKSSTWRNTTDQAIRYVMEGTNIHPVGIVTTINIGYNQKPNDLAITTETVDNRIPDFFQEAIKYAAAAYLRNLDGGPEDISVADKDMIYFTQLLAGANASSTVPQQR